MRYDVAWNICALACASRSKDMEIHIQAVKALDIRLREEPSGSMSVMIGNAKRLILEDAIDTHNDGNMSDDEYAYVIATMNETPKIILRPMRRTLL